MNASYPSRAISFLVLVPMTLSAQVAREHDPVPLKNWSAPLYWQPAPAERETLNGPLTTLAPLATTTNLPLGTNALVFVAMTPCRAMDTRASQGFSGALGPPGLAGGLPVRTIPIQSSTTCPIPSLAQAYSFNVTVVSPGPLNYLTLYPATASQQAAPPNASTLNAPNGGIVANAAVVPAGTDGEGSVDVYASNATDLIIDINGYYAAPTDLHMNTALGIGALQSNTTGFNNTASGASALTNNTTGLGNTADGTNALYSNTTGGGNTASGFDALGANTTGSYNTASGAGALQSNTTGQWNTASGYQALQSNTTGGQNTAGGSFALQKNTTGIENTATGSAALLSNTTGSYNAASGTAALLSNTTGSYNAASGYNALMSNTTGSYNTAVGISALNSNAAGNSNIAIGLNAAINVFPGNSNNIHIGNAGAVGDSGTIRIGSAVPMPNCDFCGTQTSFFAAGIRGVTTGNQDAIPVVIDSNGQLGTVSSSRRFKEDIQDMGEASSGLLRLRPVTFRYRQPFADGSKPIEYGLIAEEVFEVYPDLVAHSPDGQIESVKYQVLDSMLLNELQKQHSELQEQREQNRKLEARLAALETLLSSKASTSATGQ